MHPQDRLFCEIAVQLQLLTRQQATTCMQAQEHEAVGQSVASIAMAFGYMDQVAVDSVLHQQQRVLDRRREAREASRAQREVESRAAAGLGQHESDDPVGSPTHRPPPSRQPSGSVAAGRPSLAPGAAGRQSLAPSARTSEAAPARYSGSWSEARQTADDTRETLDERPPMRASRAPREAEDGDPRRTKPLAPPPLSPSSPPTARSVAEAVLGASHPSALPPAAATRSARSTLIEGSNSEAPRREPSTPPRSDLSTPPRRDLSMPPRSDLSVPPRSDLSMPPRSDLSMPPRRDLSMPPRSATGRPIPSVRDWRNPSRPPPATESFEGDTPLQPMAVRRS